MEQYETYVPGMVGKNKSREEGFNNESPVVNEEKKVFSIKPIVGFLYSISSGTAEYWPLYVGTNIIGRSPKCDIVLNEKTVSNEHASLVVRKMRSTGKVVASIKDLGSDVGMFLNDLELDFESHTCKNEDTIIVGSCYKCVLLLIDAEKYGLSVAEDFIPAEETEEGSTPVSAIDIPNDSSSTYHGRNNPYRKMAAEDTVALNGDGGYNTAPTTSFLDSNNL
jgi:hypothetical protein